MLLLVQQSVLGRHSLISDAVQAAAHQPVGRPLLPQVACRPAALADAQPRLRGGHSLVPGLEGDQPLCPRMHTPELCHFLIRVGVCCGRVLGAVSVLELLLPGMSSTAERSQLGKSGTTVRTPAGIFWRWSMHAQFIGSVAPDTA